MKLILLTIDALQPAYLGAYGNEWLETPTFDAWAARGVVFDQHFADRPAADSQSWRMGQTTLRALMPPARPSRDLLDELRRHNIAILHDNLSKRRTTQAALEQLAKNENAVLTIETAALVPPWNPSVENLARYLEPRVEDTEPPEPWLDPLPPAIDPADDATFERLQGTYAAAVADLDARLGALVEAAGDAVWCITSRRGLPLGEHGAVGYPAALHEELIHLPLMLVWPDGQHAGRRIAALTQPMDLAPTIAALFGFDWPADGDPLTTGRSVLPLIHSPHATIRPHAITSDGNDSYGVRSADWYLLHHGDKSRLYVKPDDRWEVNDLCQHNAETCEELERVYGDAVKTP